MEMKNQNLIVSRKASTALEENCLKRNIKRSYSVYPVNKKSLENMRAKHVSHSNVVDLAEAVSRIDCRGSNAVVVAASASASVEPSYANITDDQSEDNTESTAMMRCQGLKSIKLDKKKKTFSSGTSTPQRGTDKDTMDTIKSELTKYKQELNEYNNATKELEDKYMKINVELGELQQTHERFIANRSMEKNSESTDSCRDGSEFSLKRKYTQIFHSGGNVKPNYRMHPNDGKGIISNNTLTPQPSLPHQAAATAAAAGDELNCRSVLSKKQKKSTVEFTYCEQRDQPSQSSSIKSRLTSKCHSKFFETPAPTSSDDASNESMEKNSKLDDIYETLLQAMGTQHHKGKESKKDHHQILRRLVENDMSKKFNCKTNDCNIADMERLIADLQNEQDRYRNVIVEQKNCLREYQTRCMKAKQIMETQQNEINKLTNSNKNLQEEVNKGIDQLRLKVSAKLRQVAPLTEKLNEEQLRYQKAIKENAILKEHRRALQEQAKELKLKIDDLQKKRLMTLNRLKNTERDLRVFRNYNTALKEERAKNAEEIKNLKGKLATLQDTHKRLIARQRDVSDKHCRDLQRRVYELESKLGQSSNSTSCLLKERDRLISELQAQINTLVHNFEVSQKHIRILRRHIHNAAGDMVGIEKPVGLQRKPIIKT